MCVHMNLCLQVKELHTKNGAQLISVDPNGLTPLHHAARLGRKEIVKYIVANSTSTCSVN